MPASGMPARVAVPSELAVNVTPLGNVDVVHPVKSALVSVGAGKPVVVTVKVPAVPTVKVVWLTLVMTGA